MEHIDTDGGKIFVIEEDWIEKRKVFWKRNKREEGRRMVFSPSRQKKMKKIMLLLSVFSGILWGSAGVFVRKLSEFGMNRVTVLSSRVLLTAIILFVGMGIFNRSMLKIKKNDVWILAATGLIGMMGLNFSYNEALNRLSLSLAAVLLSLTPAFVLLLSAIFFQEKITAKKIGCMILAMIGCAFASGIFENSSGLKWSGIGVLIGIVAAIFYALYSIFSKSAMERGYGTVTIIFYSVLLISLVLFPFTDWGQVGAFVKEQPVQHTVFLVLYAVFTSILPYVFYTVALSYVDTGIVSILASGGEPIAAAVFGMLFFSEIPTLLIGGGLVITIIALVLLCKPEKEIPQRKYS